MKNYSKIVLLLFCIMYSVQVNAMDCKQDRSPAETVVVVGLSEQLDGLSKKILNKSLYVFNTSLYFSRKVGHTCGEYVCKMYDHCFKTREECEQQKHNRKVD